MKTNLVKTNFGLKPISDEDIKRLKKIEEGEVIVAEYTRSRNYRFLKKYMALIQLMWENDSLNLTRERYRKEMEIAAGYFEAYEGYDGGVRRELKSISFGKMEEEYELIGLSDIDPEARKIAVLWVEEYVKDEGFALMTKHKLASDFMNYAKSYMDKNFKAECSRRLAESMTFEREQKLIDLFNKAGSRKLTKKERQIERELRK